MMTVLLYGTYVIVQAVLFWNWWRSVNIIGERGSSCRPRHVRVCNGRVKNYQFG